MSGCGVALLDVAALEFPTAFVAMTENVYAVPLDNPCTTHEVAGGVTRHPVPPGDAVMVY